MSVLGGKILISPFGRNAFHCFVNHSSDFFVSLIFSQVQTLETLQFVSRLHQLLLQLAQLLLFLLQNVRLIVYLPLQTLVLGLEVCTLFQNLVNTALDFIHSFIHQSHIFLFSLSLFNHFPQSCSFLVMSSLHLLNNAHKDLVSLTHPHLFLLNPRLVEMMDVLQSFMQLHHSVRQNHR